MGNKQHSETTGGAALRTTGNRRHLPAGAVLMREGDVGHSVYLVLAGLVRVERSDRQMPPEELGPGSVVGRTGPTDGSLRLATVTAVEDTEVLELRLRSHPCWKPLPSSPELAVPRLRFIPRP